MNINEMVEQLAEDLKNYASTDAIFGEPMELEGVTVVPVSRMSVGYGGGGGEGEDSSDGDKASGGGAGGGVRIEPTALIIASEGDASVVQIKNKESTLETLIEKIPETVEKITESQEDDQG